MRAIAKWLDRRSAATAEGDIGFVRRQRIGIPQVIDDHHGALDDKRAVLTTADSDRIGHDGTQWKIGARIRRGVIDILTLESQSAGSGQFRDPTFRRAKRFYFLSEISTSWALACWSAELNSIVSRNALSASPYCSSILSSSEIVKETRYPSGPSK